MVSWVRLTSRVSARVSREASERELVETFLVGEGVWIDKTDDNSTRSSHENGQQLLTLI